MYLLQKRFGDPAMRRARKEDSAPPRRRARPGTRRRRALAPRAPRRLAAPPRRSASPRAPARRVASPPRLASPLRPDHREAPARSITISQEAIASFDFFVFAVKYRSRNNVDLYFYIISGLVSSSATAGRRLRGRGGRSSSNSTKPGRPPPLHWNGPEF